ncbi:LPP20 family lipoprotein [Candidatus Marinimicrobia bacterium]|nr:LPP20 family lipoprotein [Candidatus Neomarinimicrobiota bacterium]MDC1037715.1 LPP20 family lipoprotein [Candidatus Neomarinimicrobiota bacterium]
MTFYSCSSSVTSPKFDFQSNYTLLLDQYGETHFVGVGNATSSTEQLAIKIAKTKALGELADNIKVTILSRLELVSTEITTGDQTQLSESVKENIISIGNATVRFPEYDVLDVSFADNNYNAIVLAKKLKKQHIEAAARDLEFLGTDKLLDLLEQ